MAKRVTGDLAAFSAMLRRRTPFDPSELRNLFERVDQSRVEAIAAALGTYASANLPITIGSKHELADYRISPYVVLTCARIMGLTDHGKLGQFIVDTKLYTSLETSFGKQIEKTFVGFYPIGAPAAGRWVDPPEKIVEAAELKGLDRDEKAAVRRESVWREIDKSCVVGRRRYVMTIKSGPQCINDTQVSEMWRAITANKASWLESSRRLYRGIDGMDIIVGLTYGTPATTNNKENQILVKLRAEGFEEEDRANKPGVLIDTATRSVRVYRAIGIDFWASIGNPENPASARYTFVEALAALAQAMAGGALRRSVYDAVQKKGIALGESILRIFKLFPRDLLPPWAKDSFSDEELVWLALGLSSFFDEGI